MIGERLEVAMIQTPETSLHFLFRKTYDARGNSSPTDRRTIYLEYRPYSFGEYCTFCFDIG